MSEIVICVPAWGKRARDAASQLLIPACLAALRPLALSYEFQVYTDDNSAFDFGGASADFHSVPRTRTPHEALTEIHAEVLGRAPLGAMVSLMNADIVPSREFFSVGAAALSSGQKALASFGVRTLVDVGAEHSVTEVVGMSARELLDWGWKNRHKIVRNCTWGSGKTDFPVTLFFKDNGDVVAHCSHLHPFLILREARPYSFRGTIDDGLLGIYRDDEVFYPTDRQVGFIEISPGYNPVAPHFLGERDKVLSEDYVVEWGKNYLTCHCRNLRQQFRLCGDKPVDSQVAVRIAERIGGNACEIIGY